MKAIKYIFISLILLIFASCDDDYKFEPGSQENPNSMRVYFESSNNGSPDFLLGSVYDIKLTIARLRTETAATIPITIVEKSDVFIIPQSVHFAAGQDVAEIVISMNNPKALEKYTYTIAIEGDEYVDTYAKTDGPSTISGSITIEWEILTENATFTNSGGPKFTPFTNTILKRSGEKHYKIINFLYNNLGYDFEFTVDEDNNIKADPKCGFFDESEGRWYFYKGPSTASANRLPCYPPGVADEYITYIYFYATPESSSYYNFNFDEEAKTGTMLGYSRYNKASSGRITFNATW